MSLEGDNLTKAQRDEKEYRKNKLADPMRCPKCGMLTSRGHFIWCPYWSGMIAGKVK
jgi:hypothetical protein